MWLSAAKLRAWWTLSKPLTHVLGILPFVLGAVVAWDITGQFNWAVFWWSLLGALLLMLVACYSGEYFDFEADTLAMPFRNRFSGGSQVFQTTDVIPRLWALVAVYVCLAGAAGVGLLLQFYYKTGPYTIALGLVAMIAAFFYSTRPIQWAYIGLGELWIWFAYGWLSVAVPFYLQTGRIDPVIHWISLPVAFSIFNVILINEFPDYPADKQVGKRNLVVRFGLEKMSRLYAAVGLAVLMSYVVVAVVATERSVCIRAMAFFLPVAVLLLGTMWQVLRGDYRHRGRLEWLCAKTILCNWGTSISLILAFVL